MKYLFLFPFVLFASLTLDEKIGLLFMAPASCSRQDEHFDDWRQLLEKYSVGGAIVYKSNAKDVVAFLGRLQEVSKRPLLVSMDAEWGLGMRLFDQVSFPRNMTLGAIGDPGLLTEMARMIGQQLRAIGVDLNLAPVADVNNNPENPVINMRSFGEDPEKVATFVAAYAKGLREAGCLSCAKHFPGHGDTKVDSHYDLPVIDVDLERLERVEFVPFRNAGVDAVMLAHLYVPAIDPVYPTSLSRRCVDLLRKDFKGLVISDALNMQAVADRYSPEEVAVLARRAGCDILLYGFYIDSVVDEILRDTIPRAFEALKKAYLAGELDLGELDASVERILQAKKVFDPPALKKRLYQEAVTLVGEARFPVPEDTAYVSFGDGDVLGEHFSGGENAPCVVVAIHQAEKVEEAMALIESLGERAIVCFFATPYALRDWKCPTLLAYENDVDAQLAVLSILKGEREARGKLPIKKGGL